MKTVGQILKESREKQSISLIEVSQITHISIAYLEAIESNNFTVLPAATFAKGLMQNYAKALNLNPQTILAIFRRDYALDERGNIILRSLFHPSRNRLVLFTPSTMAIGSSVLIGLVVAVFFIRQITVFMTAPSLILSNPPELAQLNNPILVSGSTSSQAVVSINNQPVSVNQDGTFELSMTLSPGEHTLVISTTSRSGRERTIQRQVIIID